MHDARFGLNLKIRIGGFDGLLGCLTDDGRVFRVDQLLDKPLNTHLITADFLRSHAVQGIVLIIENEHLAGEVKLPVTHFCNTQCR